MRLCLNDSGLGAPYREMNVANAKVIYDIGFRLAGVGCDLSATDKDISRVKEFFTEAGLEMGPIGIGLSAIRPDKSEEKEHKMKLARALKIGGKLGCTSLRYSVGSLHPTNIWMHHPENHTQKALDMLIESTRELVPVAEDSGCMLCPETTQWTIVGSIGRMREYVDRLDSPYAQIVFDPVNHMTSDRVYDSGRFIRCAIRTLGDRIGVLHVKDVIVQDKLLVSHIDETDMGTGVLDHEAVIRASTELEPWKTFSLEHFQNKDLWKPAYDYLQSIASRICHKWTDQKCTRERWEKRKCK